MHVVPFSERERCLAKIDVQIENLRVLVSRAEDGNGELERIGGHLAVVLGALGGCERIEVEAQTVQAAPNAECATLNEATLVAAGALQEAIASVGLMRLRDGAAPSLLELRDLGHRLALAEAAFGVVAVSVRRFGLLAKDSRDRS
jgi:hypothetical protein